MTINKSARRSHLMTSASTRRILLEGFDSHLNEFKNALKGQKQNKDVPGRQACSSLHQWRKSFGALGPDSTLQIPCVKTRREIMNANWSSWASTQPHRKINELATQQQPAEAALILNGGWADFGASVSY